MTAVTGSDSRCNALGLQVGYQQANTTADRYQIFVDPPPPLHVQRPLANPGSAPTIVIDAVLPMTGQARADCTDIAQSTAQVITGRAFNVDPNRTRVAVYAVTDRY